MPIQGQCKLCQLPKTLCKSHYMPRALYPRHWQQSRTATREVVNKHSTRQLKDYLLCQECEKLLDQNGEAEVLRWIAPAVKRFPLHERLRITLPRQYDPELSRYAANDIGVDAGKFGYFALSIVWRGAVNTWRLPDGTTTSLLRLGTCETPIRKFLLGETGFPYDAAAVIVIVCNDEDGRKMWGLPGQFFEGGCDNIRFAARGVVFRVLLEPTIPQFFHEYACVSSRECLFYADCAHRIRQDFAPFFATP